MQFQDRHFNLWHHLSAIWSKSMNHLTSWHCTAFFKKTRIIWKYSITWNLYIRFILNIPLRLMTADHQPRIMCHCLQLWLDFWFIHQGFINLSRIPFSDFSSFPVIITCRLFLQFHNNAVRTACGTTIHDLWLNVDNEVVTHSVLGLQTFSDAYPP